MGNMPTVKGMPVNTRQSDLLVYGNHDDSEVKLVFSYTDAHKAFIADDGWHREGTVKLIDRSISDEQERKEALAYQQGQ
jgi:hypothetical protein